ncbi:MAG: hypothetical protein ABI646_01280 [Acidobacteriota bacterium]
MKKVVITTLIVLTACWAAFAQSSRIAAKDVKRMEGPKWTGTLIYLDYSSNKKTSIKSNLTVTRKRNQPLTWIFAYEYPDEPKANRSSDAMLEGDGQKFFGETFVAKEYLPNKTLRLVTTQPGTDNDKKALFRYTYLVSSKTFSIKKEVQIEGSSDWFQRNEYSWMR